MKPNRRVRRAAKAIDLDVPGIEEISEPILRDYLRPLELAKQLKVNYETIKRWHRRGGGPPKTLVGRKVYYARAGVTAWLAARTQQISKREGAVA